MQYKMINQKILLTVDNVVFRIINGELKVLLIKRLLEPYQDMRALPGGFVKEYESLEEAAHRELQEETSVSGTYLEQLYTFSDVKRDPRARVVSCVYMTVVNKLKTEIKAGSDAKETNFFSIKSLPKLAFDHKKIMDYAIKRLKRKIEYTNIAQYLLPKSFTLTQLQKVYEIVLDQELDVRNFRKKIDKLNLLRETGDKEEGVQNRPAKLYEFIEKDLRIVEVL